MSRINNLRLTEWMVSVMENGASYEILFLYEDDNGSTKVLNEGDYYYVVEGNTAVLSVADESTIELWEDRLANGIENWLFTDYESVSKYWGEIPISDFRN